MAWINWKNNPPVPGNSVYVRDLDAKDDWEIGWCIYDNPNEPATVVLPADPSLSKQIYDQWQPVPPPTE